MSDEPKWLTRAEVERIHFRMIEVAGGAHGLREPATLESALGRPRNQHAYGETDIFQLAAGYAEALSRTQAFVDGNKRTAWMSAYSFLNNNGKKLLPRDDNGHVDTMEALGQGHMTREAMGDYLRQHSRDREQKQSQPPRPTPQKDQPRPQTGKPRPGQKRDKDRGQDM